MNLQTDHNVFRNPPKDEIIPLQTSRDLARMHSLTYLGAGREGRVTLLMPHKPIICHHCALSQFCSVFTTPTPTHQLFPEIST